MPSLFSQSVAFTAIRLFVNLRNFFLLPFFSRIIGSEGLGYLGALSAYTMLASTVLLMGTNTSIQVFIPQRHSVEEQRNEFWNILQINLIVAVLAGVLPFFLPQMITHLFLPATIDQRWVMLTGAHILCLVGQQLIYSQIINNRQGRSYGTGVLFIILLDFSVSIGASIYWGVTGAYIVQIIGIGAQMVWGMILIHGKMSFSLLRSFDQLRIVYEYYHYGFYVFVAGLAGWVISTSDRIILAKMVSASELGVYQTVYGLASQISELGTPVYSILLPAVSAAIARKNFSYALDLFSKSQRYLIMVFLFSVLMLSLFGKEIILLITTHEFLMGAGYIPFIAAGVALLQIFGYLNYNLHAHHKGKWIIYSTMIGALVNVGLNFLLIPDFGPIAAAWSTLAAYFINFIILYFVSARYLEIPLEWCFFLKNALACFVCAVVTYTVKAFEWSLIGKLVFGLSSALLTYALILWGTGAIRKDEILYLRTMIEPKLKRYK